MIINYIIAYKTIHIRLALTSIYWELTLDSIMLYGHVLAGKVVRLINVYW